MSSRRFAVQNSITGQGVLTMALPTVNQFGTAVGQGGQQQGQQMGQYGQQNNQNGQNGQNGNLQFQPPGVLVNSLYNNSATYGIYGNQQAPNTNYGQQLGAGGGLVPSAAATATPTAAATATPDGGGYPGRFLAASCASAMGAMVCSRPELFETPFSGHPAFRWMPRSFVRKVVPLFCSAARRAATCRPLPESSCAFLCRIS